jgi:hypothetical protein
LKRDQRAVQSTSPLPFALISLHGEKGDCPARLRSGSPADRGPDRQRPRRFVPRHPELRRPRPFEAAASTTVACGHNVSELACTPHQLLGTRSSDYLPATSCHSRQRDRLSAPLCFEVEIDASPFGSDERRTADYSLHLGRIGGRQPPEPGGALLRRKVRWSGRVLASPWPPRRPPAPELSGWPHRTRSDSPEQLHLQTGGRRDGVRSITYLS